MISSQFKYTVDLGVEATKTTFKLKKSKKDLMAHILCVAFIFLMVAVLVWDIIRGASLTIDIIIIVAFVCTEIFDLLMPVIIIYNQRKFLKKLNLAEIEYTVTQIDNDKCTETYYKDNKIVMQNVCDMNKLVAYQVTKNNVFIVFNNFACAILDISTLNVSLDDALQTLDKAISKNKMHTKRH